VHGAAVELESEVDGAMDEEALAGCVRPVVFVPVVEAVLEVFEVLVGQEDGLGAEAVLEGIEPGTIFSLDRFRIADSITSRFAFCIV
jgi:hypothetical protein